MDNYHIYEEIGRGKSSIVYKGRKKKSILFLAIKSVDKSKMEKVLHEVQIMYRLDHMNILKFYNWYETRNHIWLILEYCTGGNLYALLTQDRRLPVSAARMFGMDIVSALHYLHTSGILYCDLKPSNILIDEYGVLKLSDFALAQRIADHATDGPGSSSATSDPASSPSEESDSSEQSSRRGGSSSGRRRRRASKRGTPCYMAPELFSSDGVHSFASDFWALGCVLYELSVGRPPFMSNSFTELVRMIQHSPLKLPDRLPPGFKNLLRVLLRKDPAKRVKWRGLMEHSFWEGMLPISAASKGSDSEAEDGEEDDDAAMPLIPQFETYLRQRVYVPCCPEEDTDEDEDEEDGEEEDESVSRGAEAISRNDGQRRTMDRAAKGENDCVQPSRHHVSATQSSSDRNDEGPVNDVDLMRLSRIVHRNLSGKDKRGAARSSDDEYYRTRQSGSGVGRESANEKITEGAVAMTDCEDDGAVDVRLLGTDTEVDFEERTASPVGAVPHSPLDDRSLSRDAQGATDADSVDEASIILPASGYESKFGELEDNENDTSLHSKPPPAPPVQPQITNGRSQNESKFSSIALKEQQILEERRERASTGGTRSKTADNRRKESNNGSKNNSDQGQGGRPVSAPVQLLPSPASQAAARSEGRASCSKPDADSWGVAQDDGFEIKCLDDAGLARLLQHSSDVAVRPILGNPAIAAPPSLPFKGSALPFDALTPQKVSQMSSTELQSFLSKVYHVLNQSGGGSESLTKHSSANLVLHCLGYMWSLAHVARLANVILNSSLLALVLTLLRECGGSTGSRRMSTGKAGSHGKALRARLAAVLATLIRHATYIAPDLSAEGLLAALEGLSQSPDLQVRRLGVAALGELTFYVTTNTNVTSAATAAANIASKDSRNRNTSSPTFHHGNDSAPMWRIGASTLQLLCRCLRDNEDDIVRHCAAKTFQNVLSTTPGAAAAAATAAAAVADNEPDDERGRSAATAAAAAAASAAQQHPGYRFATQEAATRLLDIAIRARGEELRCTAAAALSHLVRLNRKLLPRLADGASDVGGRGHVASNGWGWVLAGLADGSSRAQQSFFNIVNLVLFGQQAHNALLSGGRGTSGAGESVPPSGAARRMRDALVMSGTSTRGQKNNGNEKSGFATKPRPLEIALMRVAEHASSTVVRAKCVLALALLLHSESGTTTLHRLCERKLITVLERQLARTAIPAGSRFDGNAEAVKYLRDCQCALAAEIIMTARRATTSLDDAVKKLRASPGLSKQYSHNTAGGSPLPILSSIQPTLNSLVSTQLPVILMVCASTSLRRSFILYGMQSSDHNSVIDVLGRAVILCQRIASLLIAADSKEGRLSSAGSINIARGVAEFEQLVMNTVEAALQFVVSSLESAATEASVRSLLPALLARVAEVSFSGTMSSSLLNGSHDIRIQCFRVAAAVITSFLSSPLIYDAATATKDASGELSPVPVMRHNFETLIIQKLLPNCRSLLLGEAPLPHMLLRVICALVSANPAFVSILQRLQLVPHFLKCLPASGNTPKANGWEEPSIVALTLTLRLVQSHEIPLSALLSPPCSVVLRAAAVVEHVCGLIESNRSEKSSTLQRALSVNPESCETWLEAALELVYELLYLGYQAQVLCIASSRSHLFFDTALSLFEHSVQRQQDEQNVFSPSTQVLGEAAVIINHLSPLVCPRVIGAMLSTLGNDGQRGSDVLRSETLPISVRRKSTACLLLISLLFGDAPPGLNNAYGIMFGSTSVGEEGVASSNKAHSISFLLQIATALHTSDDTINSENLDAIALKRDLLSLLKCALGGSNSSSAKRRRAVHKDALLWESLLWVQREEITTLATLADEVMALALT